jgi:hypothetical protein
MINIDTNIKLEGEYNIVITRGDGTTEETGWFKNLILNQGLDRLGANSGVIFSYAQVGSGTTPPLVTNESLETYVASSNTQIVQYSSYTNSGASLYYGEQTFIFTFTQGAVVGTIAEVGVSWENTAGNNLFSRALILDGSGNPTTLSLTSIDQLTVYYKLRFYPTIVDAAGSVLIGATSYNYTIRVAGAGSWGNSNFLIAAATNFSKAFGAEFYAPGVALNPITSTGMNGSFAGSTYNISTSTPGEVVTAAYVPGSYYIDATFTAGVNVANGSGGFQGMYVYWGNQAAWQFQVLFNNPIPKDNTKQFTLVLRYSWARA